MIVIIPARGGSRRIPRKNIKLFHGKPIIQYSIAAALHVGQVYVSTDDIEIAEVSRRCGAGVLMRPEGMDDLGTQEVMQFHLKTMMCEVACCLYATAPMVTAETLLTAYRMLHRADYVVPVAHWLQDPGQFYMGHRHAFVSGQSLIGPRTAMLHIDPRTAIDINEPEDWLRAEAMYEEWNGNR